MELRSSQTTKGRRMAGARSLWRATGMKEEQFGKPIIAVVNSFTQFVPGHVHLHKIGQEVKQKIEELGCYAAEFNTIAVDDGIAMGHSGMLYSLPSRDIIADSVEYMCNAHKVDAMVCISNCDKITPGMLMAAMRLNIPTVFVSGGPMEAGIVNGKKYDLVDVMIHGGQDNSDDELLDDLEKNACPTCGSCSGTFTANSMNCLTEALGMALPGNGTVVATHTNRKALFDRAANLIVDITERYYYQDDASILPQSIVNRDSVMNAMSLDIAMGGSSNTVLHLLAVANEAGVDFKMKDIDMLSRKVPHLCKVSPSSHYHIEDVNRAGGIMGIMAELNRAKLLNTAVKRLQFPTLKDEIEAHNIINNANKEAVDLYKSAPTGKKNLTMGSQSSYYKKLDTDRKEGCIRNKENAYSHDGGLAVLFGNLAENGCIIKTAGVDSSILKFEGKAKVFESQEAACEGILSKKVEKGDVVIIRYEGPKGGPGMQEMLYPTTYLKSMKIDKECALITDGRFSGGTSGLSIGHVSPEAAAGGNIALIRDGDSITIDIPNRRIELNIGHEELERRRSFEKTKGTNAFTPIREREVSKSLKMYSAFVSSADKGAIREI